MVLCKVSAEGENKMKIIIKDEFKDDYITRKAGERLRNLIIAADADNELIELDFSNLLIASASFFDEGIAKLLEHGWTKEKIGKIISLKKIHTKDQMTLNEMLKYRSKPPVTPLKIEHNKNQ